MFKSNHDMVCRQACTARWSGCLARRLVRTLPQLPVPHSSGDQAPASPDRPRHTCSKRCVAPEVSWQARGPLPLNEHAEQATRGSAGATC